MFSAVFISAVTVPSTWVRTLFVIGARATALGFNQSLWIYTTEVYPTSVRAFGLGLTTACARIGGAAAPFMAHILFKYSHATTIAVCIACALLAAILTMALPHETYGKELADTVPPSLEVLRKFVTRDVLH